MNYNKGMLNEHILPELTFKYFNMYEFYIMNTKEFVPVIYSIYSCLF